MYSCTEGSFTPSPDGAEEYPQKNLQIFGSFFATAPANQGLQSSEKSAPTVDMEIGMAITAVIFDAFGTTLRITSPSHPYRQLLREGAKLGRRPTSGDAHKLLTLDAGIREAADCWR